MKQILFSTLLLFSTSVFGQDIVVKNIPGSMSQNNQRTFQVDIPNSVLNSVKKNWLKYLQKDSEGKASVVDGNYLQEGVVNTSISPNPFSVYSKLQQTSDYTRLTVWFMDNEMIFFSRESDANQEILVKRYVYDFAFNEYQGVVAEELKSEVNDLDKLKKEMDKLVKSNEASLMLIGENKRLIERTNAQIEVVNNDIHSISYQITDQKKMVIENAADPNALKGAEKTLKSLEKEKRGYEADNERSGKLINKLDKEIRSEERKVDGFVNKKQLKETDISNQEEKIRQVKMKLDQLNSTVF